MGQIGERHIGRIARQLRYPLESRGDVLRTRRSRHLSLQWSYDPAPPSLHRVPWGGFPCITGTTECSDCLLPFPPRFVLFAPFEGGTQPPRAWGCSPGSPYRITSVETEGPPRFLGDPNVLMPCSQTPAGPPRQALRRLGAAFRPFDGVG